MPSGHRSSREEPLRSCERHRDFRDSGLLERTWRSDTARREKHKALSADPGKAGLSHKSPGSRHYALRRKASTKIDSP